MTNGKPEFATNRPGERVADAVNAHLAFVRTTWADRPDVAIATAYFNVGGYRLLADELEHPRRVRLLLGAEPHIPERRVRKLTESASPARAARARLRRALDGHARTLAEDRDLVGFTIEADQSARRLVDWLHSGTVEVRRLEDGFLHGKAFMVESHDHGVIAGSSNFTYSGLATNIELNLGQYQPSVVAQVREWFNALWDRAEPFDLASLYAERFHPHAPYLVYLRMLYERYGVELEEEREAEGVPRIHLTTFQRDGLWRARRILDRHHGVLIADEVGLGKTFLAGELIREAVEERRQRVLVVAPATLRDGPWRKFLETFQLGVQTVSYEQLVADRQLNPHGGSESHLRFPVQDYALVVIDEAHALRNPSTHRANAIRRLLAGTPPKDLVMLSATPVNNSLWDLYYLLTYFLKNDATFADIGIRSLRDHFAVAMGQNPDDLGPEHLFDVLDATSVRRTRSFVKRYYPNDTVTIGGMDVTITFPTPRVERITYTFDSVLADFFDRFAVALEGPTAGGPSPRPDVLTLARYAPSQYRLDQGTDAYEVQLAGLLRSGLLKRFESSAHAFARTCRKMAASHDAFLELLDHGKVASGSLLADWIATDSDDVDAVDEFLDVNSAELYDAAEFDREALEADVRNDRELLVTFAAEAEKVAPADDPKLAAIVDTLAAIAAEAEAESVGEQDTRDKRKVLVFSYYADTVDWIADHLDDVSEHDPRLAAYRGRITAASGRHGTTDDALWGFAPRTTDAPPGADDDLFDVLVTTDVLAEGVNLQQARHIINADLPWNPQRLVQRHGRIDRIGSPHREVFMRCVFPDRKLDELLGLEERLLLKIKQAARTVGAGEILPGSEVSDVTFTETRDEIERIRAGDPTIFETGGARSGALSGEEYRQELRAALENEQLAQDIARLPWGSGSGFLRTTGKRGYVFCCRVGDHPRPLFRFVDTTDPHQPAVVDDTLACLAVAHPPAGYDTPRVLDDATYQGAFSAWEHAREEITTAWNHASDPRNLAPKVPATLQRAAELVRAHKPQDMTLDAAERLIDTLQAPYPERIVRQIRWAMASSDDGEEQVRALASTAEELGLEPSSPPEALPEIEPDDVHLVCWLALVPEPSETSDAPPPAIATLPDARPAPTAFPSPDQPIPSAPPVHALADEAPPDVPDVDAAGFEAAIQAGLATGSRFELRYPGRSLLPDVQPGGTIEIEPADSADDGEEMLVHLGDQIDPDTGTSYAIRTWWAEHDETGHLVGLALQARAGSGVAPLAAHQPGAVRVVGRVAR